MENICGNEDEKRKENFVLTREHEVCAGSKNNL